MEAVKYIQKDQPSGMKYSIVSHDKVTAKIRPEMVANGVVYYPVNLRYEQQGNRTQVQLDLRFANIDDRNDFIDVSCIGYGCDNQDKGPGKAVSYAVKYGLLKALGLETGDDPDLDDIDHKETYITKEQAIELDAVIADVGADRGKFLKYLGVENILDLPENAFGNAIAALEKKRAA